MARCLATHRRELADRQQLASRCQVGGDAIGVPGTFAWGGTPAVFRLKLIIAEIEGGEAESS
jgi:hypothetical protein